MDRLTDLYEEEDTVVVYSYLSVEKYAGTWDARRAGLNWIRLTLLLEGGIHLCARNHGGNYATYRLLLIFDSTSSHPFIIGILPPSLLSYFIHVS